MADFDSSTASDSENDALLSRQYRAGRSETESFGTHLGSDGLKPEEIFSEETLRRGLTLSAVAVNYRVERFAPFWQRVKNIGKPKEHIQILSDINLELHPGELIALMGPSGAGKSSLLNVLSGRVRASEGEIRVNGRPQQPSTMRHLLNYIPQEDTLYRALTPRELLMYQVEMQLPQLDTEALRQEHVNKVLRMLDIERCADTVIGDENQRGISGGQRKRVSIAMGFLSDPRLLFLDEPTSGLDSNTAEEVVDILQSIVAETNRTVVCTIHQPSWRVFTMFRRLVLVDMGRVIYDGPTADVKDVFAAAGFVTPPDSNPADHFMSTLIEQRRLGRPVDLSAIVQQRRQDRQQRRSAADYVHVDIDGGASIQIDDDHAQPLYYGGSHDDSDDDDWSDISYPSSFLRQLWVLLRRGMWMVLKDPKQFRSRMMLSTFVAVFLGICYLQLPEEQNYVQSRLSVLFTSVLFNGMNSLMLTVVAFPQQRAVVLREYADGIYSSPAFYLAKIIEVCSTQLLYGMVFLSVLYWMAGLVPTALSFFLYAAVGVLVGAIGVTLGFGIGVLLPSIDLASSVVVPMLMPLILFSGFLIPYPSIADRWYILWLYYVSFFQWSFKIMAISQFNYFDFAPCRLDIFNNATAHWLDRCALSNGTDCTLPGVPCPFGFGKQPGSNVLAYLGIDPDDLELSFYILLATYVAVAILSFSITLYRLKRGKD